MICGQNWGRKHGQYHEDAGKCWFAASKFHSSTLVFMVWYVHKFNCTGACTRVYFYFYASSVVQKRSALWWKENLVQVKAKQALYLPSCLPSSFPSSFVETQYGQRGDQLKVLTGWSLFHGFLFTCAYINPASTFWISSMSLEFNHKLRTRLTEIPELRKPGTRPPWAYSGPVFYPRWCPRRSAVHPRQLRLDKKEQQLVFPVTLPL